MRRRHDHAAGGAVLGHDFGQPRLRGPVERRRRLVEQPQRPARREQPAQADAAALSCRQVSGRQIGDMREAETRQRRVGADSLGVRAEHRAPEIDVLGRRQGILQRLGVTDVMRHFGQRHLARLAFERAAGDRQQSRQSPQQR
jgi:hypothetical protein